MVSFLQQSKSAASRVPSLIAVLLLACIAHAQQPAPARKRSPSMTTETMLKRGEQPAADAQTETPGGKTSENASANPSQQAASGTDDSATAEEEAWRERVAGARDRAKAAERAAEEGELRITALRNQLAASGHTAQARNETAAELSYAGQQLVVLKTAAKTAAEELAQLLEVGRLNRYSEAPGPDPIFKNGDANQDYYKARFIALNEALQTAERRVQLYDDRVRDLSQRIMQTGGKDGPGGTGGGDNFYLAQLQEQRQGAQQQLDEARAASVKAHSDLDALKEEARRAGVPPGIFR